mmetsp:Transcript_17046/g.40363  ORF Transcript_17046/g.40363 Transcript_17046/m.40363 type:complete len:158 (+) Transcript_17046:132-605(+)|eukprot:CAMPEP_0181404704 /NCGR_PEP_ID=MMETSP1110-20121109/4385_1 /TAXON_ID=174948 /ORGANISM="Symbiodinium sp., Strain CCMP421" /LENGTH=157 /DNA_ID=CAMNT_0023527077 /DNA_START=132 /DNA_END=602 /DNA_ORIENTATION=+
MLDKLRTDGTRTFLKQEIAEFAPSSYIQLVCLGVAGGLAHRLGSWKTDASRCPTVCHCSTSTGDIGVGSAATGDRVGDVGEGDARDARDAGDTGEAGDRDRGDTVPAIALEHGHASARPGRPLTVIRPLVWSRGKKGERPSNGKAISNQGLSQFLLA